MRQAVMTAPGTIELREVPVPSIGQEEVLVRIARIGVCGSDIHVWHGKHPYTSYPVVQGHEVSGTVVDTGAKVTGFSEGDKVTIEPQVFCGVCYACRSGMYNICDHLKVIGFQAPGAASDYFAVPASRLVKLPQEMDLEHGALIEPLAVACRAAGKAGDLTGKRVLVLGAGPIGNLTAQVVRARGAAGVLIVDPNTFRLGIARKCGIDLTLDPGAEDPAAAIARAFGEDEKADVIFECTGVPAAMETAVSTARKGTQVVVVGVFGEKVPLDMATVNEKELSLIGTARYIIDDFRAAVPMVTGNKVRLAPLVTHGFPLTDYTAAYRHIEEHGAQSMKVMIKVSEG